MDAVRTRGGGLVITALTVGALVLSGCAAGKKAPTSEESAAIDGNAASIGNLLLREVAIAAPANGPSYAQGSDANLQLTLVNDGRTPDTLTGVTTSAAASVSESGTSGDLCSPATSPTPSSSASGSGTAETSGAASSSASSSSASSSSAGSSSASSSSAKSSSSKSSSAPSSAPSSAASSGAAAFAPITIAGNCRIAFGIGAGGPGLALHGLTAQLFPAAIVNVTFTFQNAGPVTVEVPVQLTTGQNETAQVVTAGESAAPSATE